ncbi:MAG: proline--tRNA ligase [Lautropia sp.]|nr:proline--tRNA ligase [Lautropia sp.]
MKATAFHLPTFKEAPADAEITSHRLMMRAGMIRKLAGGIYTYMPLGLRVVRRIENIIREEMDAAGAIELLMPVVQPAELWMETGRWEAYGPELMRIRDRHERDFIIQPTSEEVITDIARQDLRSYRQLPKNFYHIQTKFRDERRPRFGVMRGREFTMKDAYSFDRDHEAALVSYRKMYDAYIRIFDRLGLEYRAVAADTGSIGGSASHEFQVIAETGEDAIVYNPETDYAANIELAEALPVLAERAAPGEPMTRTATPGQARCADVARYLELPLERTIKSIVLATEKPSDRDGEAPEVTIWLLMLRGDHDMNEIKVGKIQGLQGFRFATETEIVDHFGTPPGYLGPVGTKKPVRLVVDRTVARMSDFVCGANEVDHHFTGVNWGRDLPEPLPEGEVGPVMTADIRNVQAGDPAPDGKGTLAIQRGIEVGHIFYLGTKYSEVMNATFIDEQGQSRFLEMGCYGIGVTRLLGAAIEQNNDEKGMIWPAAIAPFEVVVCPMGLERSEAVREATDRLAAELEKVGIRYIVDDRNERPGVMFADWELIGVPLRITVGDRGLKEGLLELTVRRGLETTKVPVIDALPEVQKLLAGL